MRSINENRLIDAVRECELGNERQRQALRQVIQRLRESHYIDVGTNCNDESGCGWDGMSRRCFCTNRRMAWFWYEDSGMWYAEAY